MRAMFGFGLLLSCASTPEGEWNGYRECPGDPPQSMQVRLEPVGGGWQGAGQMEWDDTNLGERFLFFNLEMRREGGDWSSLLRDCGLEWGGVVEDTGCPDITLRYEDEGEPLLVGDLYGCPVVLGSDR